MTPWARPMFSLIRCSELCPYVTNRTMILKISMNLILSVKAEEKHKSSNIALVI